MLAAKWFTRKVGVNLHQKGSVASSFGVNLHLFYIVAYYLHVITSRFQYTKETQPNPIHKVTIGLKLKFKLC